jgi:hypothetical protein
MHTAAEAVVLSTCVYVAFLDDSTSYMRTCMQLTSSVVAVYINTVYSMCSTHSACTYA